MDVNLAGINKQQQFLVSVHFRTKHRFIITFNICHYCHMTSSNTRPPDKSVYLKIIFLFLNQNICCGYSKEPSRWDGSFEHPKHMIKLMDKKIIAILHKLFLLNWPYAILCRTPMEHARTLRTMYHSALKNRLEISAIWQPLLFGILRPMVRLGTFKNFAWPICKLYTHIRDRREMKIQAKVHICATHITEILSTGLLKLSTNKYFYWVSPRVV